MTVRKCQDLKSSVQNPHYSRHPSKIIRFILTILQCVLRCTVSKLLFILLWMTVSRFWSHSLGYSKWYMYTQKTKVIPDGIFQQGISSRCAYTGGDRQVCQNNDGKCQDISFYDGMKGNVSCLERTDTHTDISFSFPSVAAKKTSVTLPLNKSWIRFIRWVQDLLEKLILPMKSLYFLFFYFLFCMHLFGFN